MVKPVFVSFIVILLFSACQNLEPGPVVDNETLDGPLEGLLPQERARHLNGDARFNDDVFTTSTGLGPLFVATSCGACHAGDGKGHPSTILTRFGQSDTLGEGYGWPGAPQLQNRSLAGIEPEYLPAGAPMTRLIAPIVSGVGFLEAAPDSLILALSDPNDADGDGISGRPNWVAIPEYVVPRADAIKQGTRYIGRFGKKANAHNLTQQTSVAYNQDMGVASENEPEDTYTGTNIDPEVSHNVINDVVQYMATLKAPPRRHADNADVLAGEIVFSEIGCAKCHTSKLKTGRHSIAALSFKEFSPYTDLLLHDMGQELNDGYTEGRAMPAEWRTAPLWGLGLSPASQGGGFHLLHDGRAKSIEEAIRFHGGEGAVSRTRFNALSSAPKDKLLSFLNSL